MAGAWPDNRIAHAFDPGTFNGGLACTPGREASTTAPTTEKEPQIPATGPVAASRSTQAGIDPANAVDECDHGGCHRRHRGWFPRAVPSTATSTDSSAGDSPSSGSNGRSVFGGPSLHEHPRHGAYGSRALRRPSERRRLRAGSLRRLGVELAGVEVVLVADPLAVLGFGQRLERDQRRP